MRITDQVIITDQYSLENCCVQVEDVQKPKINEKVDKYEGLFLF